MGAPASALGIEGVSDALADVAHFGGGVLADDPERRRTVAVGGYVTTAVLSAGIGAASAPWQAAVLRAVATNAPPELRGSAFGLLAIIQSAGNLAASTIAGVLWTAASPGAAFVFLASAMTIATVALTVAAWNEH